MKNKGIIYATYTVDGVKHTKKVAEFRHDNRSGANKRTYVTLYPESGVTHLDIEPALYEVIGQAHKEAREKYLTGDENDNWYGIFHPHDPLGRAIRWLLYSIKAYNEKNK